MKTLIELGGLKFNARNGASDEKTIKEVVGKKAYEKKGFKIEAGEKWIDLGGNIGAFTVLAASRGCSVLTYEPDPFNCQMIHENLALNGLHAVVKQKAIVHDDMIAVNLNLWPDGQSWRNSIIRNKKGTRPLTVMCENFFKIATPEHCVKMDIEGAEIKILESWPEDFKVKKLVFEYSFDVDPSVRRLRKILEKLTPHFTKVLYSKQVETLKEWKFFPPCTMVHCFN